MQVKTQNRRQTSRFALSVMSAVMLAALTACGGGGGSHRSASAGPGLGGDGGGGGGGGGDTPTNRRPIRPRRGCCKPRWPARALPWIMPCP